MEDTGRPEQGSGRDAGGLGQGTLSPVVQGKATPLPGVPVPFPTLLRVPECWAASIPGAPSSPSAQGCPYVRPPRAAPPYPGCARLPTGMPGLVHRDASPLSSPRARCSRDPRIQVPVGTPVPGAPDIPMPGSLGSPMPSSFWHPRTRGAPDSPVPGAPGTAVPGCSRCPVLPVSPCPVLTALLQPGAPLSSYSHFICNKTH